MKKGGYHGVAIDLVENGKNFMISCVSYCRHSQDKKRDNTEKGNLKQTTVPVMPQFRLVACATFDVTQTQNNHIFTMIEPAN